MPGLHFDEFFEGQTFEHAITRTITEADNILFSAMTYNPQPLHIDFDFASRAEFGKPLVNSLFTLGLLVGLTVHETTLGTTVANLGFENVRFPAPIFHGDTLRARTTVAAVRESRSRPETGIVTFDHRGLNQHGTEVVACLRSAMMRRRPLA